MFKTSDECLTKKLKWFNLCKVRDLQPKKSTKLGSVDKTITFSVDFISLFSNNDSLNKLFVEL